MSRSSSDSAPEDDADSRPRSATEPGEPREAEQLFPLVYEELRRLARARLAAESSGQTFQATVLVHEA